MPWIVSLDEKAAGGYAIQKRTGSTWSKVDGGAVKIAVAPNGDVWIVDDAGNVRFRRRRTPGGPMSRARREKSPSLLTVLPGRSGVKPIWRPVWHYKFNGSGWDQVDASAIRLAVGAGGAPWIVNANKEIYWRQKDKWELQDGIHASDIAVDAKGPAWVLGAEPDAEGNFAIYQDDGYHGKFDGWRWRKFPGAPRELSCSKTASRGS